jgi:enterochelin esterase-like enzyme
VSGPQLRKHEQFASRIFRNRRDLIVYLPPGYDARQDRRFPVLYLQDGQNLFDGETSYIRGQDWHVGHSADDAIRAGRIEPLIIVGVYNASKTRVREYTPWRVPKLGGGGADRYAKFLREEVMPFIQAVYRVESGPERTGIGGSSLGGLLSLYLGLKMPNLFGKVAALSPSVWWDRGGIHRFAAKKKIDSRPKIWLDIGTREGPRIADEVDRLRDVLLQKGWELDRTLHFDRVEGAEHNEAAWARRVGPFLEFLFPAK